VPTPGHSREAFFSYDRELGMNMPDRIRGRVVDFVDTPYYMLFKEKYLQFPKKL
jgi:hypothetical protein